MPGAGAETEMQSGWAPGGRAVYDSQPVAADRRGPGI